MKGWSNQGKEQLRAALQSIWAHRMRSMLTTLGIIIGVTSVITVVNLTKSLEARIMADVNQEGSLTFFLSPGMSNKAWRAGKKVKRQPLDAETIRDLQEMVPQVKVASPDMYLWGRNSAKAGDVTRRVLLHAIGEQGLDLANLKLAASRPPTAAPGPRWWCWGPASPRSWDLRRAWAGPSPSTARRPRWWAS